MRATYPSSPTLPSALAASPSPSMQLDRIMTEVVNEGNEAVIQRLETQFAACNVTFSVLSPETAELFDNTIVGCETVDFVALNATACAAALDSSDVACPDECALALSELPAPCIEGLVARNATTPAEELLDSLCLTQTS